MKNTQDKTLNEFNKFIKLLPTDGLVINTEKATAIIIKHKEVEPSLLNCLNHSEHILEFLMRTDLTSYEVSIILHTIMESWQSEINKQVEEYTTEQKAKDVMFK